MLRRHGKKHRVAVRRCAGVQQQAFFSAASERSRLLDDAPAPVAAVATLTFRSQEGEAAARALALDEPPVFPVDGFRGVGDAAAAPQPRFELTLISRLQRQNLLTCAGR